MKKPRVIFLFAMIAVLTASASDSSAAWKKLHDPAETKMERRKAFISLLYSEKDPRGLLSACLTDQDPQIRSKALYEYYARYGSEVFSQCIKMKDERDLRILKFMDDMIRNSPDRQKALATKKALHKTLERYYAANAAERDPSFPFYKRNIRLCNRPDWDFDVVRTGGFRIPAANWRFQSDPKNQGHVQKFYEENFDDSKWLKVSLSDWTAYPGYKEFRGIGWYRGHFRLPAKKPDDHAVELHFHGVDEDAWVFINGKYVGAYLIGKKRAFQPFWLDATNEVRWNGENQITIRIRGQQGGVTKPVDVDILK